LLFAEDIISIATDQAAAVAAAAFCACCKIQEAKNISL
jgi:hypothetical protein